MTREYNKYKILFNKKPYKKGFRKPFTNYVNYYNSLSREDYLTKQKELYEDNIHVWFSRKLVSENLKYPLLILSSMFFLGFTIFGATLFLLSVCSIFYEKYCEKQISNNKYDLMLLDIENNVLSDSNNITIL
jgi:hypothetical protein